MDNRANDLQWSSTPDIHRIRRKLILDKHPEIRSLMKIDPNFKWQFLALVFFQLFTVFLLRNVTSLSSLLLIAYFFSSYVSHTITICMHHIAHNQAFGYHHLTANIVMGYIANLLLIIPGFGYFKRYHSYHHIFLGNEELDPDRPSNWELRMFTNTFGKLLWIILTPIIYHLRPILVNPVKPTIIETMNMILQMIFDALLLRFFGWRMVGFLFFSYFISYGLHPFVARTILEHFVMFRSEDMPHKLDSSCGQDELITADGQPLALETFSYYGPWNKICFNFGYHVEHHDFPSIPPSKLPLVKKIAPEFYDNLPHHTSLIKILWEFITNPSIGIHSRLGRKNKFRSFQKNH
ncbi:sphingolipid delta(4)-desaturase DES1-like [Brevipalpus obovatus]|uniref:sphingolipid delta(4)-desaturase DES1-like n=1 Tax=Brevipalpus obovatus TaxID=246614 RepID=UPI003D9E65BB